MQTWILWVAGVTFVNHAENEKRERRQIVIDCKNKGGA